jgi:hypothetical protein
LEYIKTVACLSGSTEFTHTDAPSSTGKPTNDGQDERADLVTNGINKPAIFIQLLRRNNKAIAITKSLSSCTKARSIRVDGRLPQRLHPCRGGRKTGPDGRPNAGLQ